MEKDILKIRKEENLFALVKNDGFQFTETFFPYTSGQIGPYYVQSIVIEKDGHDYNEAIRSMMGLMKDKLPNDYRIDVISGGESRDWDFSNPIAVKLVSAHTKIYKNGKVLGADMNGRNIVHVADLNNEGSSPRDLWVPAIKKAGGDIEHIFFYVDRMEDGVEVMKDLGLQSHAVVPLDKGAWDYLSNQNIITDGVYSNLRKRMENKDAWAKEMLLSDPGLETLSTLLEKESTKAKGEKILNVGYPQLKEEIMDRLAKKNK